jgi:hypothetical protein
MSSYLAERCQARVAGDEAEAGAIRFRRLFPAGAGHAIRAPEVVGPFACCPQGVVNAVATRRSWDSSRPGFGFRSAFDRFSGRKGRWGSMVITMHRSGGFAAVPALSRKLSVDTASLPGSEAEHLESAVRAARIPELAQSGTGPPHSGDRFQYHLTVNDGTASHTVTVTEPFADPAVGTLIDLLSSYQ